MMAVMAAVAGSGTGRASHATAARLLRLGTPLGASPIHVTVDAGRKRPRLRRVEVADADHAFFAVKIHRSEHVAGPVLTIDGVESVDAARALIDTAPTLSEEELEAAFERARRLGLLSTEVVARRFAELGGRGRAGTPKIRRLLEHAAPNVLDSRLEVKAWRMLRASHVELPLRQVRVDLASGRRHRLDFAWPELLLAFETEGFEWHGSRARWKQDRARTAALERLGWRIVVATWDDVVHAPDATIDRIDLALRERRSLSLVS